MHRRRFSYRFCRYGHAYSEIPPNYDLNRSYYKEDIYVLLRIVSILMSRVFHDDTTQNKSIVVSRLFTAINWRMLVYGRVRSVDEFKCKVHDV